MRRHIKPALGAIRLARLRPDQVQGLYALKLSEGLSPRTVHFIHSVIHRALVHAVRWGLVPRNVSDLVEPPRQRRPEPVVWSLADARRFLKAIEGHRLEPVFILAIATGVRIGEALGLHHQDIDWTESKIHIRHAIQEQKGKGIVVVEPKTKQSRRAIKVPEFAMEVLRDRTDRRDGCQGLLFTTRTGLPISPRNVVRDFHQVLAEAGLPRIRSHDLRHTCATLHLKAGTHLKTVQVLLGHSSIALTGDTYSHVLPEVSDEAAGRLHNLLAE